jgi:hypothetical protein
MVPVRLPSGTSIMGFATTVMEKNSIEDETDLISIGQSKGKFGGGQRRVFKQTQKKTPEGNKPKFATYAVIGNRNGLIGVGYGKAKETVPAREKSFRSARMNIIKIKKNSLL